MTNPPPAPDRLSPDDVLPPVEPPSATFIVQLFVIPAVIVLVIVGLLGVANWWWASRDSGNPAADIRAIGQNHAGSWQAAHNLAESLRHPAHEALRHDAEAARELAALLQRQIDSGAQDENSVRLRGYCVTALGMFEAPDVLPMLLKAAQTERDPAEMPVRFAALRALEVYLAQMPRFEGASHAELLGVLQAAAQDERPAIRSAAAFALSGEASPEALARVKLLLDDAFPDVRFNAAMSLARHGAAEAGPVLIEMLDPAQTAALEVEDQTGARDAKRHKIHLNALRAVAALAEANPQADLGAVRAAVARLANDGAERDVQLAATELLRRLDARPAPAATAAPTG